MPTAMPPTASQPRLPNNRASFPVVKIIGAATFLAAAELALGLVAAGFFDWGRAEALLFLAFRPWLLLLQALLFSKQGWRGRFAGYALFLVVAASCETLLLLGLGASSPWEEALRGIAAGAALVLVFDLLVQGARRLARRWGGAMAAASIAILLLTPAGFWGYEKIILPPERAAPGERPDLMVMTALPIIWGEGGAFDPQSRPAASYRTLEGEFRVRPLDVLDDASLDRGNLLLLAQPPLLAPHELASLDNWVRRGGRVLILTDPSLVWPSRLPLGDIRRPPPIGLLGPLLEHWGLSLEPLDGNQPTALRQPTIGGDRRLVMEKPGIFVSRSNACENTRAYLARCRIGKGMAILAADADMMRDELWVAPAPEGERRHRRLSDNPLIVADWLDELGGHSRERIGGRVEWLGEHANRMAALLLALLPLLSGVAALLILHLKRGR